MVGWELEALEAAARQVLGQDHDSDGLAEPL
jgi:hypothetical protein